MCVDEATIVQLKDIMGDDFKLLISTFINDSMLKIETMRQAISSQDSESLRTAAHSLKGSALNLSASNLTQLCMTLEDMGKSGTVCDAEDVLNAVELEYKAVTGFLVTL